MSKHSPDRAKRHKVDRQARHQRKLARGKLLKGLKTNPRTGSRTRGR